MCKALPISVTLLPLYPFSSGLAMFFFCLVDENLVICAMGRKLLPIVSRQMLIAVRRSLVSMVITGLFCVTAFPSQGHPQRQNPGRVQGQIVNALTNEPVRKARVYLQRLDTKDAAVAILCDDAGNFVLSDINPGRYHLAAERVGYIRGAFGARSMDGPGLVLVVAPGQLLDGLIFKLMPQAVITGRVIDGDGEPVQDVHVQALGLTYVRGRRQLVSVQDSVTDDLGEYRLHSLPPNRYLVSASRSGGNAQSQNIDAKNADATALEETYAPTYFPNTVDPTRAVEVSVTGGEQARGIDLTLLRTPTAIIRGHVANSLNAHNTAVMLFPRDAGGIPSTDRNAAAVTDNQGNFELRGVTPGGYILFAQSGEGSARIPIDVYGSNINDASLTIVPNLEVRGRMSLDGGPVHWGDRRVNLGLQPRDTPLNVIASALRPDGAFLLSNVSPDNYALNIRNLPEEYCVKEIHMGLTAIQDGAVNLSASGTGPLDIVLSRSCAEFAGVVTDFETNNVPGATVTLVPDKSHRSALYLYQVTTTDQYGGFSFKGVAPGSYRVYAWEVIDEGAYFDPDFLKAYESFSTAVTAEEKSRENLQLTLIPAGTYRQPP
jgi:protocatechuate 3,4-dioxygenase beta subunit